MNKKYLGPVVLMLAAVAGLAAMGLVFCWCCPDRLHDVGGVASRWCFKRQIVWNIAGVSAALLAVAAGWKRLLKAAPFLFSGWVALWIIACLQPVVDGSSGFVRIGPVALGVWSLFPVALAMLAAWLRGRYLVGGRKFLCGVCAGAILALVLSVAASPDRIARINSFFRGEPRQEMSASECMSGFVQHQTREAFAQAHWFSACENEILNSLPGAMSYSVSGSWCSPGRLSRFSCLRCHCYGGERAMLRCGRSSCSPDWDSSSRSRLDIAGA